MTKMAEGKNILGSLPVPNNIGGILQVNTTDLGGGAEKCAYDLMTDYRSLGYDAWMAVGIKRREDLNVFVIPNKDNRSAYERVLWSAHDYLSASKLPSPIKRASSWTMRRLAEPMVAIRFRLGIEANRYRGTKYLLQLTPKKPAIVHLHNLHGSYFDLRFLPALSHEVPVFLTLHDTWTLTGYCTYNFGCDRFVTGCGKCPQIGLYSKIYYDGSASNWRQKKRIYSDSLLHVATPSQWLMDLVERSMLGASAAEKRVIPYGIDLARFKPGSKQEERVRLGLPPDAKILLYAANGIKKSVYKDFATLRAAVERLCAEPLKNNETVLFLAVGESGPSEFIGKTEIRFIPFQKDPDVIAQYYRAADLLLHAAREDNFPMVILEALACGTPVVATAVGGIPEQIRGLLGISPTELNQTERSKATGALTPARDPEALAAAVRTLLDDASLLTELSINAAADAKLRFNADLQIQTYLTWYADVLSDRKSI